MLLAGRRSFLGNAQYWAGVLADPDATPIRREFARLFFAVEKVVVSDRLQAGDIADVANTRIVRVADAHTEVAQLKAA